MWDSAAIKKKKMLWYIFTFSNLMKWKQDNANVSSCRKEFHLLLHRIVSVPKTTTVQGDNVLNPVIKMNKWIQKSIMKTANFIGLNTTGGSFLSESTDAVFPTVLDIVSPCTHTAWTCFINMQPSGLSLLRLQILPCCNIRRRLQLRNDKCHQKDKMDSSQEKCNTVVAIIN